MNAVLDIDYHHQLLLNWPGLAENANIAEHWIDVSAKGYISTGAVVWLKNLHRLMQEGNANLMLTPAKINPEDRASAMGAACFRNYLDAKVMTLGEALATRKTGVPRVPVLFIPDFYTGPGALAAYEQKALHSLLVSRQLRSMATVLYVASMQGLRKDYGEAVFDFVKDHYVSE